MRHIAILFSAFIAFACAKTPGGKISGSAKSAAGKYIYLQKFENNTPIKVDSSIVAPDGTFEINYSLPATDFYSLNTDNENGLIFLGDSAATMHIVADEYLFLPTKIEGSEATKLMLSFNEKFNTFLMQRDSIAGLVGDGQPSPEIMIIIQGLNNQVTEFIKGFVDQNYQSPAALVALGRLDPVAEIATFKKVRDALASKMAKSYYFQHLEEQIKNAEYQASQYRLQKAQEETMSTLLAIGSEAPNIELPDPSGKTRSLKSLRGKVVLIDFWASWCPPCRAESKNVVYAYDTYKSKGFEVFSVSLDRSKPAWENAIKEDKLNWSNHVSDLQFWNSAAAKAYGVSSIPFTVLIGRDGKIIAKNLRSTALVNKLNEVLKN